MNSTDLKRQIAARLGQFARGTLADNTLALLSTLGYRSEARVELESNAPDAFLDEFDPEAKLDPQRALLDEWKTVDFLFQLTGDDLTSQLDMFRLNRYDRTQYLSYVFLAIELRGAGYARGKLAQITREINKLFPMPAMVLFKHRDTLTLAIINRRPNKRDADRDVLDKVTLIKDVVWARPHRAHIEILFDLSLEQLQAGYALKTFNDLHDAWQKALDSSELNKRFFSEVANWYFWAVQSVGFPSDADPDPETRNAVSVIRLITRLIFVWFLKEKGLVPDALFDLEALKSVLKYDDPQGSTYYKAILQNLFFATLNTEMDRDRKFRITNPRGRDAHFMVHNVYRYERYFQHPDRALDLFSTIPFLNGGLFECLDRPDPANDKRTIRVDGFSDRADNPLAVPDRLFFDPEEHEVDLNEVYGTAGKRYKVRGLIDIFNSYKFTIDENTPVEQEVALDPELLGQVFENLLAAYNPETGTTARKQTGSFYTPREIVNYMVDESLIAYLETRLAEQGIPDANERLRHLFAYNEEPHRFSEREVDLLLQAIDALKILDPACGSGAFPMGILHKLVYILAKLDPHNARWEARQIAKASEIADPTAREAALTSIEDAFARNELDYGRKLYLIENCIYGVDIQPIAVQIAKLRFFISLVVEQVVDDAQPNRGILPLPNLETKFVAANTLLGVERPQQLMLPNPEINQKEKALAEVRQRHFTARSPATKERYRQQDAQLRAELSRLLQQDGWTSHTANVLAHWDPYDQNMSAPFFDLEWMFGITDGFDVVIGNPPYGAAIEKELLEKIKKNLCDTANSNSAALFIDLAKNHLSNSKGIVAFIVPKSLLYSRVWFTLVKALLPNTSVIVDVEQAFSHVLLEQVVFVYSRGRRFSQYRARKFIDNVFTTDVMIPIEYVNRFKAWICDVSTAELEIALKIMHNGKFMHHISTSLRGLPLQRFVSSSGKYRIIGGKNINRYCINGIKGLVKQTDIEQASKKVKILARPKVIAQQIIAHVQNPKPHIMIIATVDSDGSILGLDTVENTFANTADIHLNLIAALYNSTLINWYAYKFIFCGAVRTMHFDESYIAKIPIPDLASPICAEIVNLVEQILDIKRADPGADTSALEAEIDRHVYQLYSLTPEEIAIVEAETR